MAGCQPPQLLDEIAKDEAAVVTIGAVGGQIDSHCLTRQYTDRVGERQGEQLIAEAALNLDRPHRRSARS